jgi:2-polyprenyl-6-hydroxyphenyl methylase/3-demethylubiquinone-9 3-methyltransferase
MSTHSEELKSGKRFAFGSNWARFHSVLDENRILGAETSLKDMLRVENLRGKSFLDVGSGSGLFSLAARRLGASVHSFDYDPQSVKCTEELKRRYYPEDPEWTIETGSVLDLTYLGKLPQFDVVYSWGVLHHTGSMWESLSNICPLVAANGKLFIAIYNDEGLCSRYWLHVKRAYVRFPALRWFLVFIHTLYPFLPSRIYRALTGRLNRERGMSAWYDLIDWAGGFPFEVASVKELFEFYRGKGFRLDNIRTTNRSGCNELVLIKTTADACVE